MQQELREKIISLIDSNDLREYLLSIQEEVSDEDLLKTIGVAPVNLNEKLELLQAFADDEDTTGEQQEKAEKTVGALNKALTRLNTLEPGSLLMTERHFLRSIGGLKTFIPESDQLGEVSRIFTSLQAARKYMEQYRFYHDADQFDEIYFYEQAMHPELSEKEWRAAADAEELEPPFWFWKMYLMEPSDNDKMSAIYQIICSPEGEMLYINGGWAPDFDLTILSGGPHVSYSPPTPYCRGDILRIDCLPYAPAERYCIVLGSYSGCFDLVCAYPTLSGEIGFGSVDSGFYYENRNYIKQYLPPLFRAELYSGELPENCAWMAELSDELHENPELSNRLMGRMPLDPYILLSDWTSVGGFDTERGRSDERRYHMEVEEAFKILNYPENWR